MISLMVLKLSKTVEFHCIRLTQVFLLKASVVPANIYMAVTTWIRAVVITTSTVVSALSSVMTMAAEVSTDVPVRAWEGLRVWKRSRIWVRVWNGHSQHHHHRCHDHDHRQEYGRLREEVL